MRRALLTLLLAGLVTALGAVAAPALTTRPYVAPPVEFTLLPRGGAAAQESRDAVLSRPLLAPKRFDVVGLRWRGGSRRAKVELRVRRARGRWSPWANATPDPEHAPDPRRGEPVPKSVSEPVWTGGADEVQYRTSGGLSGVELDFINTTGTATAADRARTALRRAANTGLTGVATLFSATAVDQPAIISRAQWGGDRYCRPRAPSDAGQVKAAFVHHTVSTNGYSPSEGAAMVLGICRYHRDSNGWDDIGYNFLVDKYGQVYEGRNGGVTRANVGAQAQGWNAQSTGIANLGDFDATGQSSAGMRALTRLIGWKLGVHHTPLAGRVTLTSAGGSTNRYRAGQRVTFDRVSGHRDGNLTDCPGDALYAQLPALRRAVEAGGGSDTTPPATPENLRATSGPARVTLGWSANTDGDLAGYRIYRRTSDSRYAAIATTRSSAFTDRSVSGGTTYYYRVKAYDGAGNESGYSNFVAGKPTVPYEEVIDNRGAGFSASGAWSTGSTARSRYAADYRYAAPKLGVSDAARLRLHAVGRAGRYELFFWHPAHSAYSQSAPIGVQTGAGTTFKRFDLRSDGGRWVSLGTYSLGAGEAPSVLVSRWTSAPGWLIADAARIVER